MSKSYEERMAEKYNFLKKEVYDNYESKVNFLSTHSLTFDLIKENSKILSVGCGHAHLEKKLFILSSENFQSREIK